MTLDFSLGKSGAEELYDVVIIGGGPAGLSAAIYAARAPLKTVVLDKAPSAGAAGLTIKMENYPGIPRVLTGLEFLDILRGQALGFGAEYVRSQVLAAEVEADIKRVTAADGIYQARVVIIATGAMGRKPSLKGEEELVGRGVSYCAICDAAFFKGEEVAVVGDSEEALDEAEVIARFASKVHIIAPRDRFQAAPEHVRALEAHPNIQARMATRVREIRGNHQVSEVILARHSGPEERLPVAGVFIYLQGSKPIVDFLAGQVKTTPNGCIIVDREMATNVPGVFACGDVTCKPVRQAVIAAAEGVLAALAADRFIHKRPKVRMQW